MGIIADELKVIKKELNNARLSINAKYKLADIQELTSMTITQLPPSIDYIPVLDLSEANIQNTDILKDKIGFAANGMVVGAMPNHSGVELLSNITEENEKNITFNITKNRKGYCDEYTRFLVDKALLADFLGITPNIIKQGENILGIEGQYQGAAPVINQDIDGDGIPDINIDINNDGIPDINIDTTGDNNPNVNIDTTGDGNPDLNIDTTGDLKPNVNIDIDGNKKPEVNIDTDGDGLPDTNLINQDTNGDGKPDLNVDTNNDNIPDINIDTDGNNIPDLNIDINNDNKPDINIDTNKDGKPDMNIDTNGDNAPDVSVDTNGDNVPDTNIDINGDNVPDINIDTDKDGKPDSNLVDTDINEDNVPDLNIDTNGDGLPNINIDIDGDNKPDLNIDIPECIPEEDDYKVLSAFVSFGNPEVTDSNDCTFYLYYNKDRDSEMLIGSSKIKGVISEGGASWDNYRVMIDLQLNNKQQVIAQAIVLDKDGESYRTAITNLGSSLYFNQKAFIQFTKSLNNDNKLYCGVCAENINNAKYEWSGHNGISSSPTSAGSHTPLSTEINNGVSFSLIDASSEINAISKTSEWSVDIPSDTIKYNPSNTAFAGLLSSYGESYYDYIKNYTTFSSGAVVSGSGNGAIGVVLALACKSTDIEAATGDGIPDVNIDTNKDGKPDINVDLNEDNIPDMNIDKDGDGGPDFNIDTDNDNAPDVNVDTDNDNKPDKNIDVNGDNIPDVNLDTDNDGIPDTNLINQDTDGDGKQDLNVDTDGDNIPDMNVDVDGDGIPDLGIDTNGDGIPDLNIDTNKDGKPDVNVDTNGDGKPDLNIDDNNDNTPDRNIDTNNDNVPDLNIDTNNDGVPDYSIIDTKTKTLSIIINPQNVEEAAEKYGTVHDNVSHYGLIYNKNDYGAKTITNTGYYKHGSAEIVYGGKPIRPINYIWEGSEITFLIKKHGNHLRIEATDFNTDIKNENAKIDIILDDIECLKCFSGKVHLGFAAQGINNAVFKNIYFNDKYELETKEDGQTVWIYYKQKEEKLKELVRDGIKDAKDLGVTLKGIKDKATWIYMNDERGQLVEALTKGDVSDNFVNFNYIITQEEYEDYILKVTLSSHSLSHGIVGIVVGYIEGEETIENPINEDLNKDSIPDLSIDTNKDGIPDTNIDTDGDKKPDLNIDTNRDGVPDVNIDTNGDGVPDLNIDTNGDNIPDLDIDTNNDGVPDVNIDDTGDKIPDRNIDTNGDNDPDLNVDTDNDGTYDTDIDINGDGIPDINIDTDNDGVPDVNVDTDNDGYPDLNVDTDNDGNPDANIDSDGDKIPDTNVQDITPNTFNFFNSENTVDPNDPNNFGNLDKRTSFEQNPWLLKWGWREIEINNEFTEDQKKRYLTAYRRFYNCINTYGDVDYFSVVDYDTHAINTQGSEQVPNHKNGIQSTVYVWQDANKDFWWSNTPESGYTNALVAQCYVKDLKLTGYELDYIYNKVMKDCPELMWKFGNCWYMDEYTDSNGNKYCTSYQMEVFDWSTRQTYLQTCEDTFNKICDIINNTYGIKYNSNCTPTTYTPTEKKKIAKVIHDYLVTHNNYAFSTTPYLDQTMYPALSNGAETPVCASYAHAFYWCCQKFGILCLIVTGYAGENHMWNMITYQPFHLRMNLDYISQEQFWQEVDVTWDDPLMADGSIVSDYCSWEFFNVTTDYMKSEEGGERYRFYSDLGYTWVGPSTYDFYICEDCQDQSNKYLNGQYTSKNGGKLYEGF